MGNRSREKATGKTFRERISEGKARMKLYQPAKKMAKRMQKTGDYSEFRDLVSELEDEDIDEFLQKLDKKMERLGVAMDPLIQMEYTILVEERKRREGNGDTS